MTVEKVRNALGASAFSDDVISLRCRQTARFVL